MFARITVSHHRQATPAWRRNHLAAPRDGGVLGLQCHTGGKVGGEGDHESTPRARASPALTAFILTTTHSGEL